MTMMGMRVASLVAALATVLVLAGGPHAGTAHACTCLLTSAKDEIKGSDAVFSGEVRSIDENATLGEGRTPFGATGKVTLYVRDSWKGVAAGSVEVYGQGDGVNCYNLFEEGEAYLVYASRAGGADGALENNECGRTRPLSDAETDLRLLGPPDQKLTDTGGLSPSSVGAVMAAGAFSISAALLFRLVR